MKVKKEVSYSIIVVCLNAGDRLKETIDSILDQKYENYEVIIKDGGSTDGSIQALPQDERIHLYEQKDSGIYDAMNQAVKYATGDYFIFLNAGDSFYSDAVLDKITDEILSYTEESTGIELKDSKPAQPLDKAFPDIIYGNLHHKALDTVIYASPEINDFACFRNVPCHQTCFYSRKLFEQRGYKPEYNVRADYEHFLWCYYEYKAKIKYTPVIVAAYEGGGYSETPENRKKSAKQHREITEHYMGKNKARKYRMIMLITLAPLRSKIAEDEHLSKIYNAVKTEIYKLKHK